MHAAVQPSAAEPTRVPARLVVLSIVGLWACYFLLATLRGVVLGYAFDWPLISRRVVVTLASMALTVPLWLMLAAMARRAFWQRGVAILLAALPVATLMTAVNDWAFADLNDAEQTRIETRDGVNIVQDGDGNVVIDMRDRDARRAARSSTTVSIAHGAKDKGFWESNADLLVGRYFLLMAWAAIYLALANAEQARAAERREGEYRQAAQAAELRSLRYQINPHFLFNTLNSLSALVLTGRGDAAERMIQMLSSYYRRSLTADPTGDLPLREEIALQRLYLDIERQRFPDRLKVTIDVPADLGERMVPGMILQPLIENAVKYAVAATARPVTVRIAAAVEGDRLLLSVEDNGPGTAQRGVVGHGIGLANVRDRLRARFGDAASLDTGALPEGGFRATLRMPAG